MPAGSSSWNLAETPISSFSLRRELSSPFPTLFLGPFWRQFTKFGSHLGGLWGNGLLNTFRGGLQALHALRPVPGGVPGSKNTPGFRLFQLLICAHPPPPVPPTILFALGPPVPATEPDGAGGAAGGGQPHERPGAPAERQAPAPRPPPGDAGDGGVGGPHYAADGRVLRPGSALPPPLWG